MEGKGRYAGIDRFRLVAMVLVVAIHTAPLASLSETLDFFVTYCAGRLAVPFFLMTSGYFLFSGGAKNLPRAAGKLMRTYAGATMLYLPVILYAGLYPRTPAEAVRLLLFDGSYYHLWYFPAAALGLLLLYPLVRRGRWRTAAALAGALYLIGLFGDSYYGLAAGNPAAKAGYDVLFSLSTYTRNGLFYTPLFLLLGGYHARRKPAPQGRYAQGFALSLLLLLLERGLSYYFGWQRHNSMYLLLPVAAYFLFGLLRTAGGRAPSHAGELSLLCYILHPLGILAVRAVTKVTGAAALTACSPLYFAAVLTVSVGAAGTLLYLKKRGRTLWTRRRAPGSRSTLGGSEKM